MKICEPDLSQQDVKVLARADTASKQIVRALPMVGEKVAAGFPSPAEDFLEDKLDLNRHLIKHPAASFFVRVSGNSMVDAGIFHNDILLVDRALEAKNNSIVVAILDGEFTVKRLKKFSDKIYLAPANPQYKAIEVCAEMDFQVWGVVTHNIHSLTNL